MALFTVWVGILGSGKKLLRKVFSASQSPITFFQKIAKNNRHGKGNFNFMMAF